mgnify:CR=1 FL=1|jgi:hypothetical protein|tara:strand:- start:31136 stop:31654 length:519 start_codon:yes stop_codon:yes gene_type:complete
MKVVDIADEIYRELGSPSDLSIPAISFWIRSNCGRLNNLIHSDFDIRSKDLEIVQTVDGNVEEITTNESAILKKLYMIHFYDTKLRANMTAMTTDTILSVKDGDSSVTKLNKNEVNKSIATVKNQEYKELQLMVATYKSTKGFPRQVAGDDTSSLDTSDSGDGTKDIVRNEN